MAANNEELRAEVARELEIARMQPNDEINSDFVDDDQIDALFTARRPYVSRAEWPAVSRIDGYYRLTVINPSDTTYTFVHLSVAFGLGWAMCEEDVNAALASRDSQWPYLTSRPVTLLPYSRTYIRVDYQVPNCVQRNTSHVGLGLLWRPHIGHFDVRRFYTYVPT